MTDADKLAHLDLAQPGDEHSLAEWEAAAAAVLRKSRRMVEDDPDSLVWEKLARTTLDGITVTPLGTPSDLEGRQTAGRPARAGAWDIRSHVWDPDAKLANEAALVDLDGGVTSLWLAADAGTDLKTVLAGVRLDLAPVVLDAPTAPLAVAEAFLDVAGETALHPGTNLGADPIGAVHRDLAPTDGWQEPLLAVARLARERGVLGVVVDATAAHDLGASDAQELGYGMAVAAAYLRVLADAGLEVAEAARLVEFRFAATDEQFTTIAKLRAARRLWARMLELSGAAEPVPMRLHAVTSRPMLSKYDPYVNMLRGTVAAFAAGVGGADAVTVLPFDAALGKPEAFGRRIARNVSHLLIDESHVAVVADPAGGAYAVERLTDDLAVAGWTELGEIEQSGFDTFRGRVAAVAEKREAEVATRRRPITGLTEFPNLAETLPEREPDPAADRVRRYGASFEALRDDPPARRVFLATLGPVAQHTARASFATNLLAAGGIGVDVAGATTGVDDLVTAYAAGDVRSPVVCLAGSDAAYEAWGAEAAAALREAGATHVIIAGRPVGRLADAVDDSAALGVDALAFLIRTREKLS